MRLAVKLRWHRRALSGPGGRCAPRLFAPSQRSQVGQLTGQPGLVTAAARRTAGGTLGVPAGWPRLPGWGSTSGRKKTRPVKLRACSVARKGVEPCLTGPGAWRLYPWGLTPARTLRVGAYLAPSRNKCPGPRRSTRTYVGRSWSTAERRGLPGRWPSPGRHRAATRLPGRGRWGLTWPPGSRRAARCRSGRGAGAVPGGSRVSVASMCSAAHAWRAVPGGWRAGSSLA